MSKWISVNDDLPDESKDYLVAFTGWDDIIFYRTLEYDVENNEWSDWNGIDYYTVLAWQHLPEEYKQ